MAKAFEIVSDVRAHSLNKTGPKARLILFRFQINLESKSCTELKRSWTAGTKNAGCTLRRTQSRYLVGRSSLRRQYKIAYVDQIRDVEHVKYLTDQV